MNRTCNSDAVDDFLLDRLNPEQQRAFEQHLDQCDHCCRQLQRQTAEVSLWEDARKYLSSTDQLVNHGDFLSDSDDTEQSDAADRLRLDFLGPTDDPRMLGRIGGYEVSGVIGCGGMGIVLKAFDSALNRYSAIKVLAPHYASSGAARQRFAREAQAAAAVVHDNVIAIHGVDEYNGLPYLVMPYIKGESLQKRIDREGTLSIAEILRIAMQTARGLAAAHDQGLVHRDIKPGNILLPSNVERVIITDFGLARAADDASLTRSGVIAGTPQYMSPEQARGEGIDARSDLFSLGSVIYAMCTGHPPFRAETPYGILRRITDNEQRPIREINGSVPDWLSGIVDRLLAKDPARRFTSASEVAELLERCLAHLQQPTVVPLPSGLKQTVRVSGRPGKLIFAATALVVLFLLTGRTKFLWEGDPPKAATPRSGETDRPNGSDVSRGGSPSQKQTSSSETEMSKIANGKEAHDSNIPDDRRTPVTLDGGDSKSEPTQETDLQWESDSDLIELETTVDQLKREIQVPE